ncbi:MAG TPA: rhomboid family intramembrane serine protease [Pirellulales bacterium]|nr:rhomboid family intramembrane serine protease [Pirellulales bacterium]
MRAKKSGREANPTDAKTTAELRAGVAEFDRTLEALTPYTPVAWLLLAISSAVFIGTAAYYPGQGLSEPFSADALEAWGANAAELTARGQGWRLLTAIFVHAWLLQLLFNAWTLFDLGRLMERLLGGTGVLLVYLAAGFSGNVASLVLQPDHLIAGSTGAIFGLLGALAGFLLRYRREFPPGAVARLRKSVPAFIAFNVGYGLLQKRVDSVEYLGGLFAGLACGLLLARPLTIESAAGRWRGNAVVGLLALVLLVATGLALAPRSDVLTAQTRLADLEQRLQTVYEAANAARTQHQLSQTEFADKIESDILPAWRRERARLESLPFVSPRDGPRWKALKQYAKLRDQAWSILAGALRSGDDSSIELANEKIAEADRVAEELNARDKQRLAAEPK